MTITWKYVKPLRHANAVENFLLHHKVRLPRETIAFLASHNGGRPSSPAFDTRVHDGFVFNSLYSYNEGDVNYIVKTYEYGFADTNLYPVALEAAGNIICFDLTTRKLVLWNHETDDLEEIDVNSNNELFESML